MLLLRLTFVVLAASAASLGLEQASPLAPRPAPASPPSQATFRAGVEVVRIDALVVEHGRAVSGLTASDFEVRDQGVLQDVQVLATSEPVNIVLVLDRSGSLAGEPIRALTGTVNRLMRGLRQFDQVALVQFGRQISVTSSAREGTQAVGLALTAETDGGSTALYDAVFVALGHAAAEPARSLVVVLSDGLDNASFLYGREVLSAARREDVLVYGVVPPGDPWNRQPRHVPPFLTGITESSGGSIFETESSAGVDGTLERALEEFRSRYLLAYVPTGVRRDDGWHELKVGLRGRAGTVNARRGYYARAGVPR